MAHKALVVAFGMIVTASPLYASQELPLLTEAAPPGGPATLYCMHIEPITGSRVEEIKCWTRAEWAEQGVDVDQDWAKEGVRVIG